jgi:uncharacterized protein YacL
MLLLSLLLLMKLDDIAEQWSSTSLSVIIVTITIVLIYIGYSRGDAYFDTSADMFGKTSAM